MSGATGPAASVQFLASRLSGTSLRRSGQALGLWGGAGIGKTYAALDTLGTLSCRSLSLPAGVPLAELVRRLPTPARLPPWAALVLGRLRDGDPSTSQPSTSPDALPGALAATLAGLAPFVLHLDDLHEADQERLDLISALAGLVSRTRGVGLLVTGRHQPPGAFESRLHAPLDAPASARLLEQQAGATLPAEALSWISARAAGNPLFTLEYFRLLTRRGSLWNDARQWRWRAPPDDPVPVTVEALVEQALTDVLGAPTSEGALARAAAAVALLPGEAPDLLAAVSGLSPVALTAARQDLERQGVLLHGDFAQPLYREMTVQRLPAAARQALATRALTALRDDPERAAGFVGHADLPPAEARRWLEQAAEAALAGGRTARAARWLAQAADLSGGEPQERARLALQAARTAETVQPTEALRLARLAATLRPGDPETTLYLAGRLVQHSRRLTDADEVLLAFGDDLRQSRAWSAWQIAWLMRSGQYAPALDLWERSPGLQERPDPDTLYSVAVCLAQTGRFEAAAEVARQGLELPDITPGERASLLNVSSMTCAFTGRPQEAEAHLSGALTLARDHGLHQLRGALLQNRAKNLERTDRFADALAAAQESFQAYAEAGDTVRHANAGVLVGGHLSGFGRYREAEAVLLDSTALLERQGGSRFLVVAQLTLAGVYLDWQQDDPPPGTATPEPGGRPPSHGVVLALKLARTALGHARSLDQQAPSSITVFALAMLARAEVASGEAGSALAHAREAAAAVGNAPDESAVLAFSALTGALIASGRPEEAEQALTSALGAAETGGFSLESNRLRLEQARLSGDLTSAAAVHDWFQAHGLLSGVWLARRFFPALADSAAPGTAPPTSRARLDVLGPLRFTAGETDQPRPVRGRKRRELLAALLEARLCGQAEVTRRDLLSVLYPGASDGPAGVSLKELVHLTRAALEPGLIRTTPGGYALADLDSDAEQFLKSGDTRLWRGPYLQDALPAQHDESVTEALHLALQARAEASISTDPQEAARVARLLLGAEPYTLGVLALLLASLRACGNHRSLERHYREARLRLSEVGETLPGHWAEFMNARPELNPASDQRRNPPLL